jgi:hypothetical protein
VYSRNEIVLMKKDLDQTPRFDPISEHPLRDGFEPTDLEPKPPEPENGIDEMNKDLWEEFKREVWHAAGVIKESRWLEGKLLALVHISKELKVLTSDSEEKILCLERYSKKFIRDGLYLVLKTRGGLSFFGGHHADKMDTKTLNIAYRNLGKVWEFAMFTMEIEEYLDAQEQYDEDLRKKILPKQNPST